MDTARFIEIFNDRDALSKSLGIRLTVMEEGFAQAEMQITENHLNFMGTLHGGTLFALADVAAGTSVAYHGEQSVTLNGSIHYIKAIQAGKIFARSTLLHKGRTTAVCDVKIYSEANILLCTCTFSMFMTGRQITL